MAQAVQEMAKQLKTVAAQNSDAVAVVLTAQYTVEELEDFCHVLNQMKIKNFFYWKNNEESFDSFDGLLLRGDKNPNTKGLQKVLTHYHAKGTWSDYEKAAKAKAFKMTLVAAPENQVVYPDLEKKIETFKLGGDVVWLTSCKNEKFNQFKWQIPMKGFVEKSGTFVNFKGIEQKIKAGTSIIPTALSLQELASGIKETVGIHS